MARETCKRVTAGKHTPERCLVAALRFLLDREPKESILSRFDVTVISHDFPEFEQELPSYLLRPLIRARELHRSTYIWFLLKKTTVCRLLPFRRLAPGIVEAIPQASR